VFWRPATPAHRKQWGHNPKSFFRRKALENGLPTYINCFRRQWRWVPLSPSAYVQSQAAKGWKQRSSSATRQPLYFYWELLPESFQTRVGIARVGNAHRDFFQACPRAGAPDRKPSRWRSWCSWKNWQNQQRSNLLHLARGSRGALNTTDLSRDVGVITAGETTVAARSWVRRPGSPFRLGNPSP